MLGIFKKKENEIKAVVDGKLVDITSVNDETFAKKLMGEGVAIIPKDEVVVAPCDCEILVLPASKHAIGIKTSTNHEILIHIGIDTVQLNGEGFTSFVDVGQKVKKGDPLIQISKQLFERDDIDLTTMIIFLSTPSEELKIMELGRDVVAAEDTIVTIL